MVLNKLLLVLNKLLLVLNFAPLVRELCASFPGRLEWEWVPGIGVNATCSQFRGKMVVFVKNGAAAFVRAEFHQQGPVIVLAGARLAQVQPVQPQIKHLPDQFRLPWEEIFPRDQSQLHNNVQNFPCFPLRPSISNGPSDHPFQTHQL